MCIRSEECALGTDVALSFYHRGSRGNTKRGNPASVTSVVKDKGVTSKRLGHGIWDLEVHRADACRPSDRKVVPTHTIKSFFLILTPSKANQRRELDGDRPIDESGDASRRRGSAVTIHEG